MRDRTTCPAADIWDLDGTVIAGSEAVHHKANALALQKLGLRKFGEDLSPEVRREISGLSREAVWKYFRDNHGLTASLEEFVKTKTKTLAPVARKAKARGELRIRQGVVETMEQAKYFGMKRAIATNGSPDEVKIFLKVVRLTEKRQRQLGIETIVTAADVVNGKPAPEVYLEAARRLGVRASDCIAIEDTRNGGRAALAAGMTLIARAEHDQSMFRSIRHLVKRDPEYWRTVFRNGELKPLFLGKRIFIIGPDVSPLKVIQGLRFDALLNQRDQSRSRQAALTTKAFVGGVASAVKDVVHRAGPRV